MRSLLLLALVCLGWSWAWAEPKATTETTAAAQAPQPSPSPVASSANSPARFQETGTGFLHDTDTNLLWTQTDTGMGYSWPDATAYCDGLKTETCTEWRLPSIEELLALRDLESNPELKIAPQFQLTKQWLWSATKETQGSAWYFHVGYGTQRRSRTDSSDIHALCVCTLPKQDEKEDEAPPPATN